jgi:hypothetical protein
MRDSQLLREMISQFGLSLDGLNVYTEAASGHYALGPILAALAGAKHVTAQVLESRFGLARDVLSATRQLAQWYGVDHVIECVDRRSYSHLSCADIVTNSGHVRPIDRDLIDVLKPTAVIPLMWETWEFRESDFDLNRCRQRGILVLGTNEQVDPCDMRPFIGLSGFKLLLELGYDGGNILVLGNAPIPGATLVNAFRRLDLNVTWVSDSPEADMPYCDLLSHFTSQGGRYSHLIVAEHHNSTLLLGSGGLLDFTHINSVNPSLKVGVICGNIDPAGLRISGLRFMPEFITPFGFMSYQPAVLGPRPVLTLYAAGLKIGERMARARLLGQKPSQAARTAMKESPAMDFADGLAWTKI